MSINLHYLKNIPKSSGARYQRVALQIGMKIHLVKHVCFLLEIIKITYQHSQYSFHLGLAFVQSQNHII